eukprot:g8683.t1
MTASPEVQFDVEGLLQGNTNSVYTQYGPLTVTVSGDVSKKPCLTYHDVGLNHKSCFTSLLVCSANTPFLLQNFCFYHIDAPGSEEEAAEVPDEILPMTMEKLADQIEDVIHHFHLVEPLGMGVGAGGYVLTLHATRHPKSMLGLILISPAATKASWWELCFGNAVLLALKWSKTRHLATEHLVQRLVTGKSTDLLHTLKAGVSSISSNGLYHYLNAVLSRGDLTQQIKQLRLKRVLLMWGYQAFYKQDSQELNRAYGDKEHIAWVEVDECGNLMTEECPFRILEELKTYIRGLQMHGHCLDFVGMDFY